MSRLAAAELLVLALAFCAALSSLGWSLLVPNLLGRVSGWEAARRHTAVLALALAPALTTTLLLLSVLGPTLLSVLQPELDHCLQHDDGHAHLCFRHFPQHAPHALLWVMLAVALTWQAAHVVLRAVDLLRAHRRLRILLRTGSKAELPLATLVEGDVLLCAAAGFVSPRVLISRQLLEALSPVQAQVLLAHETMHVRRRDALSRLIAGVCIALLYPRALRVRIAQALELAAEQACDEEAARCVGDRLTVAETILRVERVLSRGFEPSIALCCVGMQDSNVAQRVEALLDCPQTLGSLHMMWATFGVGVVLLAFFANELHHTVESLLSPLLS